jgi:hypothetical protein
VRVGTSKGSTISLWLQYIRDISYRGPTERKKRRDVPGDKGGRCVRQTTYHHIVPMSRILGALTLLDPSGPAWPVMGVLYLYLLLISVRG